MDGFVAFAVILFSCAVLLGGVVIAKSREPSPTSGVTDVPAAVCDLVERRPVHVQCVFRDGNVAELTCGGAGVRSAP